MYVLAGAVDAVTRRLLERLDRSGHVVGVLGHTAARLEADGIPYALDLPVRHPRDVERHLADATALILRPGDPPVPPARLLGDTPVQCHVIVLSSIGASSNAPVAWLRDAALLERVARRHENHTIIRSHLLQSDAKRIAAASVLPDPEGVAVAFVHVDDLVNVIMARLQRSEHRHIMVTGPRLWTMAELARATDQDSMIVEDDLVPTMLEAGGLVRQEAARLAAILLAHRGAETTRAVQAATGQPPHSLEVVIAEEEPAATDVLEHR